MYNGLTTADKDALLDAKQNGAEWIARDENGMICGYATKPSKYNRTGEWYTDDGFELITKLLKFIKWSDHEPVNIDLALAQIAEMESGQNNSLSEKAIEKGCTFCCYTEYPDTKLYPRDKIEFFATRSKQIRVDVFDEDELDDVSFCPNCGRNLNSPYTEGATK